MSQAYKRFITLLEKWPIDKTRQGRDLGQFLRQRLADLFGGSKIVSGQATEETERQFQALENIIKDVHKEAYPRSRTSTASGLTGDQCRQILSSEFLELLNDKESRNNAK